MSPYRDTQTGLLNVSPYRDTQTGHLRVSRTGTLRQVSTTCHRTGTFRQLLNVSPYRDTQTGHLDVSPYQYTQTQYADSCQPVVAVTSRFRVIDGEVVTKCQLICLSHSRRAHLQSEHLYDLLSWTIIKYNWFLGKDSWGKKEKQAWYISYCRCDLRRGKISFKKN